jgi:hypothetical protein
MNATATACPGAYPAMPASPRRRMRVIVEVDDSGNFTVQTGATGNRLPDAPDWYGSSTAASMETVLELLGGAASVPSDAQEQRDVDLFLDAAYLLSEADKTRDGLDHIFQKMNTLLVAGKFRLASSILKQVDVERLSPTLLVGFLSITLVTDFLPERPEFYARVRRKLVAERGAEATDRLLCKYNGHKA